MNNNFLSFTSGIDTDRVYAHRGDIFICEDLFKEIDGLDKDDHILAKPTRPVLIISADKFNINIVRVLPFSSKSGSIDENAASAGRLIRVPGVNNSSNPSYIDVSQIFTINTYQLKVKLGHASQEIVDAAVALHTLQNVSGETSINTLMKIFKDKYPKAKCFSEYQQKSTPEYVNKQQPVFVNNFYNPSDELFSTVQRVSQDELLNEIKSTLKYPENRDEANALYQEWLQLGTDIFIHKYGITRQQYINLRDKCVNKMLGKVANFKKYDWST